MKHVTNQVNAGRRNFLAVLPKAIIAAAVLKELPFGSKAFAAQIDERKRWEDVKKHTNAALTSIDKHVGMRNARGMALPGVAFMAYGLDTKTWVSGSDAAGFEAARMEKALNVLLCIKLPDGKYITNSFSPGKGYETELTFTSPSVAVDYAGKPFYTDMEKIANVYFITKDKVKWEAKGEAKYAALYGLIKASGHEVKDFRLLSSNACIVAIQQPPRIAQAEPENITPPDFDSGNAAR